MPRTRSYLVPTLRDVTYGTMMRLVHIDARVAAWWAALGRVKPMYGEAHHTRTWMRVKWVSEAKMAYISMVYAGYIGDETLVNMLVDAGNAELAVAVHGACRTGHAAFVERLMGRMEVINGHAYSAFMAAACRGGHRAIAERMLAMGTKAKDVNWGLRNACRNGHLDLVELMIEHGATDINDGMALACQGGHVAVVEHLLALDIDENQREMAMMLIAKDARVSGALRPWHK